MYFFLFELVIFCHIHHSARLVWYIHRRLDNVKYFIRFEFFLHYYIFANFSTLVLLLQILAQLYRLSKSNHIIQNIVDHLFDHHIVLNTFRFLLWILLDIIRKKHIQIIFQFYFFPFLLVFQLFFRRSLNPRLHLFLALRLWQPLFLWLLLFPGRLIKLTLTWVFDLTQPWRLSKWDPFDFWQILSILHFFLLLLLLLLLFEFSSSTNHSLNIHDNIDAFLDRQIVKFIFIRKYLLD